MKVNGYHQLSGYQHSIKYIYFCVQQNKETQVWNNMMVTKHFFFDSMS